MEKIREKWTEILLRVKEEFELADVSFRIWVQPLKIYSIDEKNRIVTVLVEPDNEQQRDMKLNFISDRYAFPIKVAITEVMGVEYEVRFTLPDPPGSETKSQQRSSGKSGSVRNEAIYRANLNPKYTFDTFVVGSNNKFAHAAALAVAESPGSKMYNPLFIYGGAGLGKTHLMYSIAHFILEQNPEKKVLYVTSEAFTNELILAIRNGNNSEISSFREKYRSVDVLLIDDIQFIIGKEATQEEFFHTFNELHLNSKQIVISSDKPPKEFETLESRLRTRFEWGILADISTPDYETRVAILHKKEEADGYDIAPDVIDYIASNIKSNIRELEGALNKLYALSHLENREINLELAEEALKDMISPDRSRVITPDLIIRTVAEHYQIQPEDICGKNRSSNIVLPRQIVMYLCRNMLDIPLKSIGTYLGDRDHSTVMHGIQKIEDNLTMSETFRNTVDIICKKINPNA